MTKGFPVVGRGSVGRRAPTVHSRLRWLVCTLLMLAGCAPAEESEVAEEAIAAGVNDRYSCVTTSQPGCNFNIGIGKSLYGAGECKQDVDFKITSSDQDRAS